MTVSSAESASRRTVVGKASWLLPIALLLAGAAAAAPPLSDKTDIGEAEALFRSGEYAECARVSAKVIEAGAAGESWRLLKIESDLAVGEYARALQTLKAALLRYRASLRLRLLGRTVYRYNDDAAKAAEMLRDIENLARRNPWNYTDPDSRITVGRVLIERGADARQVLELIYDRIKKEHPEFTEAHIATGDLALRKHDYAVAGAAFRDALRQRPDDPDILAKLARAQASGDPKMAAESLAAALEHNPRHAGALILAIDRLIDSEAYAEAGEYIERLLAVNPRQPQAWAYRAVLAHLAADGEREESSRSAALASWSTNPEVDHLIGRKLSQKYRFREGAAYQRRALKLAPGYLAAKLQLAQDLLRLGEEEAGWRLADEVAEKDSYNVVAYNLTTLRDHLDKFATLERNRFVVRMEPREARVYGDDVLDLLGRARDRLLSKYEVDLEKPTIVEIFPQQKDFAIRTFGLPGGAGFLGVCFGSVITANSPASREESPANWQAVLWHEFCHVVTLAKTRNKMPRWLSEGISVYEERQAHPAWGQGMTAQYREMILGDELIPVSRLSAAFLSPPSPLHLQFAYYESSLVVEYIIERYGLEALKRVLADLARGVLINDALESSTGSLEELERDFAAFARAGASALAPAADWTRPELPPGLDSEALAAWNSEHPDNFWGLSLWATQLVREEKWQAAKGPLQRLVELHPMESGAGSAYTLLATVHRRLNETARERAVLEKLASTSSDALDAYLRLMQLAAAENDWQALAMNAERTLAVNPLLEAPHRHLARASEALGYPARAIRSYRSQLLMDPLDPAEVHYRLARLLVDAGDLTDARREVLKSLEEAPRFRAAHRLLLEVVGRLAGEPTAPEAGSARQASKEKRF